MASLRGGCVLFVVLTVVLDVQSQGIPAKTLADVKASTVYVKVSTTRGGMTGSGFILTSDGESAVIVTNDHVISPPTSTIKVTGIEVVFNSGKAKEEKVASAEVLATDPEADLAILKVTKQKGLPKAISRPAANDPVKLSETTTVYTLGFPLGDRLSVTDGNPAVTVTKSSVSSLREDEAGELVQVQLEGGSNPGNSGGPVVDERGRLVGVVVAKINNTNIGFAIPTIQLDKLLAGKVLVGLLRVTKVEKGKAEVEFATALADPFNKLKNIQFRYLKADTEPAAPEKGKPHPVLPNAKSVELKRDGRVATGKLVLDLGKETAPNYLFQIVYGNSTKGTNTFPPRLQKMEVSTSQPNDPFGLPGGGPSMPGVSSPGLGGPSPDGPRLGGAWANPKAPALAAAKLPAESKSVGEVVTSEVRVSEKIQFRPGKPMRAAPPALCWAADAKSFFTLDMSADAVVCYTFPELKEQARLPLGKEPSWLSLSSEGLVVTVAGAQEAWVLDPVKLKKKSSFPVNKAERVLAAPGVGFAYAVEGGQPFGGGSITVFDLKTGKSVQQYAANNLGGFGLENPILSPDGKSIFTKGGIEQLQRFAVDGKSITPAGSSGRIVSGAFTGPCTSADGLLVAAPAGGGNSHGGPGNGPREPYTTFVFSSHDLSKPLIKLGTGAYPTSVGFDLKAGLVYAQNYEDQLIILDMKGSKLKSMKLPNSQFGGAPSVTQFLVHPDGGKLLMQLDNSMTEGVKVVAVAIELK